MYIFVRHLCDLLGISYQGQIDRIRRDPVLSKYEAQIGIVDEQRGGGSQATNCLALKYVPGWLFGINASRVRGDVRAKQLLYQEQVYDVSGQAFREEVEPPSPATIPAALDDLAAIEQMGLAIYRLARQQRVMEARLENVEGALWEVDERTRAEVDRLRQQLTALELRLAPRARAAVISEQQAADLSQAAKTVAMALVKKGGRNEFGAIYGELYHRFGIAAYRNLPAAAYQEAMTWLKEWFRIVTAGQEP